MQEITLKYRDGMEDRGELGGREIKRRRESVSSLDMIEAV